MKLHLEPPELVVFDLSAVLQGYSEGFVQAYVSALRAHGMRLEPELVSVAVGCHPLVGVERLLAWLRPKAPVGGELTESVFQSFLKEFNRYIAYSGELRPMPGVDQTLERLEAHGVLLAVHSTLDQPLMEACCARARWTPADHVHTWMAGDAVQDVRPGPGMIRASMAALGIESPARVAKVGDTPTDMDEGRNAGCGWRLILDGGWLDPLSIERSQPHAILEDIDDLLAYLPLPQHPGVRP